MPHYLKLRFDPDFDSLRLRPGPPPGGADCPGNQGPGYVQNVVEGEVLALWSDAPPPGEPDPRFVFEERVFPAGPNCRVDPANRDRLLASASGYAVFRNGLIEVRTTLGLRGDVDFHTGNIVFVGDLIVVGDVRPGFTVQARNIRIKGKVEQGQVKAAGSLQIDGGIVGSRSGPEATAEAGRSIRVGFCENARLAAGSEILVDHDALNCDLLAGHYLAVRETLQGGDAVSRDTIHVGRRLGSSFGTTTRVILGYEPFLLQQARRVESAIQATRAKLEQCALEAARGGEHAQRAAPLLEAGRAKLESLTQRKDALWEKLDREAFYRKSRLIVPGEVREGVEMNIGPAYYHVTETLSDSTFSCYRREILIASPAEAL